MAVIESTTEAGWIGVLSDAHGHGYGFERAVEVLTNFGATNFIFLGDAIGYIPSLEVLRLIRSLGPRIQCIRGNHEDMLIRGTIPESSANVTKLSRIRQLVSQSDLDLIRSWPDRKEMSEPNIRALFVHGSPRNPVYGRLDAEMNDLAAEVFSEQKKFEFVFVGNTHRPFIREVGDVTVVNVGSCGLPRDDGRFGSVALFSPKIGIARIIRFQLGDSVSRIVSHHPDVHSDVVKLFNRRAFHMVGEIAQ